VCVMSMMYRFYGTYMMKTYRRELSTLQDIICIDHHSRLMLLMALVMVVERLNYNATFSLFDMDRLRSTNK